MKSSKTGKFLRRKVVERKMHTLETSGRECVCKRKRAGRKEQGENITFFWLEKGSSERARVTRGKNRSKGEPPDNTL